MKTWHILIVVAVGIAYGAIAPGQFDYAFGHVVLYVFLPPLLFEAAWNSNYRAIVRVWRPIAALAIPGVVLTAAIIAGVLYLCGFPLQYGMVVGAILSATDPIAVVAVFRQIKVPTMLATLVECESLFNDATAVVLYGVAIALISNDGNLTSIVTVTGMAILSSLGGVAFGVAIAFFVARLLRNRTHDLLQIESTIVCAFTSYIVGNALHLSGVFAVIACGIALRYFERRWISLRIATDVSRFWDIAAIVCNAFVFFLVGASLPLKGFVAYGVFAIVTIVAVVAARYAVTLLIAPARFPTSWMRLVRVAGIRGALSIALALALPPTFFHRDAIVAATFAVAIFTLAVGGPLAPRFATLTKRPRANGGHA